MHCYYIEAIVG